MTIEIKVPVLPESVADATIATWHKRPGENVMRDDPLVDIETDKVVLEVVAPKDGSLAAILSETGDIVKAEQVIAQFSEHPVTLTSAEQPEPQQQKAPSQIPPAAKVDSSPIPPVPPSAQTSKPTPPKATEDLQSNPTLSPAVRRIVGEQDIDPSTLRGSGKDNRVTVQDVQNLQKQTTTDNVAVSDNNGRIEKRVPMTRLRAKIAERLLSAQHNAAILTTFNEVDMAPVITLRNKYKEDFEKKYGVRLGFMSFFVNAAVAALKQFPAVNASIDGSDLVYHGYYDIGIAVSTDRGLVVPIVRNADELSMADIERKIVGYSKAAKEGKLAMEDISGGTFTITNGGVFGSLMATPIINPPQSAILGMHKIMERPVVVDKQIVIRPMMYVALSYDHRIIDGAESVQFLVTIKEMLEDPARLILSI